MTKIIAEVGINHNAKFDNLIKLADMAMESGADYVKLQLRTPTVCVPEDQWKKPKQWFDGTWTTYIEYRERMELPFYGEERDLEEFDMYMKDTWGEQKWFASVWDLPSLRTLLHYDVPYIKIPSAKITDLELVKAAHQSLIPVILSTGMSTFDEIDAAYSTCFNHPAFTLLHCNSAYPTDDSEVNLNAISTLKDMYGPHSPVGFSSHSASPFPALYAMVMGIDLLEVHITLDRAMQGGDHAASLERNGLALICRERDRIRKVMGDGVIRVYESEKPARLKLRGD